MNCINNNKLDCGIVHFQNDPIISITSSNFSDNTNKGNGGAMYVIF